MCGRGTCSCGCGQSRPAARSTFDDFEELDQLDALEDSDTLDELDDVADWSDSDLLDDSLDSDFEGDQFTFGTDDRFQVRAQARPPSTRLFPFNTVCQIPPASGSAGPFTDV